MDKAAQLQQVEQRGQQQQQPPLLIARLPSLQSLLSPAALLAHGGAGQGAYLDAVASAGGGSASQSQRGLEAATAASAASAAFSVMQLTDGVIGDIYALSHASFFVGTCLSQVSRLAYDLAYASGRARAPPVGLDAAACRAHPRHFFPIAADWREGFDAWADP